MYLLHRPWWLSWRQTVCRSGGRAAVLSLALGLAASQADSHAGQGFPEFLADFRQALARNDAAGVAALTRLPFLYEGVGRDRAGFLALYPRLFDTPVRRCLARSKPLAEEGAQVIFCRPYAFYFRPVAGTWRLVEFGADGEDMP